MAHLYSDELQDLLGADRCAVAYPNSFVQKVQLLINLLTNKKVETLVCWNLGVFFMIAPIYRFLGKTVIYTKHEPDNFKSRFAKTDKFLLSMIQHLLVEYYSKLYNKLIVFNSDKCQLENEIYLPLIFKSNFLDCM